MNRKSMEKLEFPAILNFIKQRAASSAGQDLIDKIEPFKNIEEARRSLNETKEAMKLLELKGSPPFEGVYDVREAIFKAKKGGTLNPSQLLHISNVVKSASKFIKYLKTDEVEIVYLKEYSAGITPLPFLTDKIDMAIIGENEISDRASVKLSQIRRALKDKSSSVKDKIQSLVRSNSKYMQDTLYTIRGDRYVLPIKAEHKGHVPGLIHDQSSSGQTLFIEPMSLVNLNNEIKDLMLKEKEEIERILRELSNLVYENHEAVERNSDIVFTFDMIFSKGKYGISQYNTIPEINENGVFNLISARHPLIDEKKVVPSTIYLGENYTSLIITGPNTGGKTVTLKTSGLLHVMALSGIPIPALDNSSVAFFEEIYADIGDEQSIEQSLSTFSGHMTNIVKIMEKADENSLVLFDELGAGTDPTEGAALAMAILETLRNRGTKVIATTHYSELKAYALRTEGVENASVEFDVNTLRPTYKLLIGVPGKSNAFLISKRLGLTDDIIEKSKELITEDSLKFEDLIENLQTSNIKAKEDALKAQTLRRKLEEDKSQLDEKIKGIDKLRERELEEAKREARNILRQVKEEADEILKVLRQGGSQKGLTRQELEENRQKLRDTLELLEDSGKTKGKSKDSSSYESTLKVKIGEEYQHKGINQKVSVLTLPDNKGNLLVQAGIMKLNANVSDLSKDKTSKQEKRIQKREMNLNLKSVPLSIDLRGLDAVEAALRVDMYLDEAAMANLREVTIIHGVGTGVLKQKINEMLKRHPHVKKQRPGEYGEGGMGVTMVEVK